MKEINLKRETLENQKGITILALIVTVIILIILVDPHIFLNIPQ